MARISKHEIFWNQICRKVFQDRLVLFSDWKRMVMDPSHSGHKDALTQSVKMINPVDFIQLVGEKDFISNWKKLRDGLAQDLGSVRQSVVILDSLWADLVTGSAYGKVGIPVTKPFPKSIRDTVRFLSGTSKPVSIYSLAKNTGKAYNRVHENINILESAGTVETEMTESGHRPQRLVSLR